MKKVLKKWLPAALALICALVLACPASALLLEPGENYYVADYAGLLSDNTKQTVIGANGALETLTGGQIVVATVKDLEGFSVQEYAMRLFDEWGVGNYTRDNGMLLLLCPQEESAVLVRGSGVADAFDAEMAQDYMSTYFWREFKNGNYDRAVADLFTQLIGWYEVRYEVGILNVGSDQVQKGAGFAKFAVVFSVIVLCVLLIVVVVVVAMWVDRGRYRRYYYGIGVPMPRYKPYFLFFGGPHRNHRYPRRDGAHDMYARQDQGVYHNRSTGQRIK